jgi:hypothetical protein
MNVSASVPVHGSHHLHYGALRAGGCGLDFPCDMHGHVDLDSLSEAARNDYFYARAVVGREYTRPSVQTND